MAEGIRDQRPAAWRALPRTLAGFFPVIVFGLVLLVAIGEWGLFGGVLAGTALGAATASALTRLIAAFPILQWTAATVIALAMVLVVLSFF
jgi:hypothetical protein